MPRPRVKQLDGTDRRIVSALHENARITFSALGRMVGLSAPAVSERVRRLEDAGIIAGYRAHLAMDKLGFPITAWVRVSAPEQNCVRLGKLVRSLPYVLEIHRVTGNDRLIVKLAVPSIADLDEALREITVHGTATASVALSSLVRSVELRPRPEPLQRASLRARGRRPT
jgi:Lrp/AsnC family transcriptional regulator, leucine-responsive regulatory protein